MKLFFTSILLLSCALTSSAQLSSLSEDFDISCFSSTGPSYPTYWTGYCKFVPVSAFQWNCYPVGGRFGTPGFTCNSFYAGTHNADTAWLFTPKLNLSGNTDHVYLRYDSRYEYSASKLNLLVSHNYIKYTNPDTANIDWYDVTGLQTPSVGPDDSMDWVTHFVDLTPYKATPLIFAFKYTSTNYSGGRWTIDNIMTTPWALTIKDLEKETIPMAVLGTPTRNEIMLSCNFIVAGTYTLSVTDLMGRVVHTETVRTPSGEKEMTIRDSQFRPGMYFIKLTNGLTYGATKAVVQ